MLFNSLEFIFLFLPAAVLLDFTLARWSIDAAIIGTAAASLIFYAWWNPPFVVLPIISILANFQLARWMAAAQKSTARSLLIAGYAGNLLVLGYFKYADFLLSIYDGHKAVAPNVPLALSFTTFVQIVFLTDAYRRRVPLRFSRYVLFVAFFPHLIAGPIVRWSNLGRQLDDTARYRVDWGQHCARLDDLRFRPGQEGSPRRYALAACHHGIRRRLRGAAVHGLRCVGHSVCFHVPDVFRFLRLLRHGGGTGPVVQLPAADQFCCTAPLDEHFGFLAAVAHDTVAVSPRFR